MDLLPGLLLVFVLAFQGKGFDTSMILCSERHAIFG